METLTPEMAHIMHIFDRFETDLASGAKTGQYCIGIWSPGSPYERAYTQFMNSLNRMGAESALVKTGLTYAGGFVFLSWRLK